MFELFPDEEKLNVFFFDQEKDDDDYAKAVPQSSVESDDKKSAKVSSVQV